MNTTDAGDVDAFITGTESPVKERLQLIRDTIKQAVPDATETIRYGIPTFQINQKNMLHYGPGKSHVGLYATPDGHYTFEAELSQFKRGKGSVQFPHTEEIPVSLIRRMALYRAQQLIEGER